MTSAQNSGWHIAGSHSVNSFIIIQVRIKVNLKLSKIHEGERRRQGGHSRVEAVTQEMV